jgi:hypothetical protein
VQQSDAKFRETADNAGVSKTPALSFIHVSRKDVLF